MSTDIYYRPEWTCGKYNEEKHVAIMFNLIANGEYFFENLKPFVGEDKPLKELRGKGLMIGMEVNPGYEELRNRLLFEKSIFTGGAGKGIIRLLPPLCVGKEEADKFITAFKELV